MSGRQCLLLQSKSRRWWWWRWRGRRPSGDWWRAGRVRTAAGGRSVLLQAPPWPEYLHSTVTCDTRGQSAAQHAAAQPPARHPPLLRPLPGAGHGPGHGEWVGAGTHTPGTSEAGKVWVTQSWSATTGRQAGRVWYWLVVARHCCLTPYTPRTTHYKHWVITAWCLMRLAGLHAPYQW